MPACILCSHETTKGGIHHHLISKTHMPFWKERIRSCRSSFSTWIAEYEAGKKKLESPLPSFPHSNSSPIRYRICFGCKKVAVGHKTHECESVEKRKNTVEMYKKILNEEEEFVVEEDEVAPSSSEMKKLQDKVEMLEKKAEVDEDRLEKADTYRYVLKQVLEQTAHFVEANEAVLALLEDYPELKGDIW